MGHLSQRRHAATVLEIVVVVAIVGILATVLVVAVQRVRESAMRIESANNLKQIIWLSMISRAVTMADSRAWVLSARHDRSTCQTEHTWHTSSTSPRFSNGSCLILGNQQRAGSTQRS